MKTDPPLNSGSQSRDSMIIIAAMVAALAVFSLDVSVELGVAGAVPYIVVIWVAFLSRSRSVIWGAAIAASVLTVVGFMLSPEGGEVGKVLANRAIALFTIWLTAAFCVNLTGRTSQPSGPESVATVSSRIEGYFRQRTVAVLIGVFAIGFAAVIWQQMRLQQRLVESSATAEAQRYSEVLAVFRTLYTRDVVETVRNYNIEVTHDFDSPAKRGKAIPLPATLSMKIGNEISHSESGGGTRLYSRYPFPYPGRNGLDDAFAKAAWTALNDDPDTPFTSFEEVDGKPLLRYAIADRMRASCVECHNSHPDSPKRDWKDGDVRGVIEVSLPLDVAAAQTRDNLQESVLFLGVMGLAGVVLLGLVIGRIQQSARDQSRLAGIVESTDDAIIGNTLDGIVTFWNRAAERLYGYAADEIIGQSITLIVPEDRPDEVAGILAKLRNGELVHHFETVRVAKNGTRLDVSLTISPIKDGAGHPVAASTIARDISERKRLEELQQESLKQRQAELDFAYARAGGAAVSDNAQSAIVRETGDDLAGIESFDDALNLWAQQARTIVGAHQSAVSYIPRGKFGEGKHALSFSEKYDKYRTYDVLPTGEGIWKLVAGQNLSFCLTDAQLKSHPAWKNFSDLRDDRGLEHPPMRGWLAVPVLSTDLDFVGVLQLTDKYEGEFTDDDLQRLSRLAQLMAPAFSLQFANEELQFRGKELVENAEQLELQRQTAVTLAEQLKKADKAKNEFLANMSHEIRTPMNAVMGLTELVLGSELDDIQRDYLTTVMDSAESLLAVINDILDFSKIEAGMLKFEEVEFQLYDTVGDTVRTHALRAQRKDLELVCFIDPAIPGFLKGDPGRLRQVLMNLIGNAIKFTESGEVVVRVAQTANENGQLMLNFSVSDTGIGIAQDKLESIFDAFVQADTSTTREFGGTGLGLAICHKLVSLMGGRIEVDSEPGQGSTFHFTAGFGVSETQSRPSTIPEELKGTRVLVVDDNETNRTILEQILLAKEMVPVTAPSALDGFTLLQDSLCDGQPFRLLISDVHMPKVDGFEFIEMIRADASLSALDIILLTSAGQQGDQQRCEDLRIDAHLTKPVKQSELYNIVLRVLGFDALDDGWLSMVDSRPTEQPALRILLVEDSIANQKVALAMLSRAGHTTVVANHGKEALAILAEQEFDVVLMDVQMPIMDGLETTAAIRAGETGIHDHHQPIVAMTAHAMTGDRERCLAAGMDGYVSKPVHQAPLFEAIAAAIGFEATETSTSRLATSSGILPSAPSPKLVDWTGPLSQLSGDHAVLKDITESYLSETTENLSRLPAAIAAGDASESQRLAHTVKGAMRFFRAEAAQRHGQKLEDLAASGDLTAANQTFEKLKQEVELVLATLQRFIDCGEM
ncbi:MAG: response regulator [Planctomycetales bacterium]